VTVNDLSDYCAILKWACNKTLIAIQYWMIQ